jgi:ribonuclease Z
MARMVILGSAYAVPDETHENTHLLIEEEEHRILIDCASNPVLHLKRAGVEINELTDLILTHFHPDHVSGVPLLLMDMWLTGRKSPLHIYGLSHTVERMQTVMELFDWKSWPHFFPVFFHTLPDEERALFLSSPHLRLYSSPVHHLIPTIGLRVEFLHSGKSAAYSCDTEPCSQVRELARGCDVLIHESSGASLGHSSAQQAAQVARDADVGTLYLIHYPVESDRNRTWVKEAKQVFEGEVYLTHDFMTIPFD